MKNYAKINKENDWKRIEQEIQNIKTSQNEGLYPISYEYPISLQFELTSKCNVKCKHCYNKSGDDNSVNDAMTVEEWKKFSQYLVSRCGLFQCVISGGEPLLLGNDLFDIMDILHEDGTSFLVITNGYLLDQEKVERFRKYRYKWFQVSIDGATAELHDEFRQRKGSWEKAVDGAYMITKQGIPLTIAHSVHPDSVDSVRDMCKLAYELGASTILLGEVMPSGRSANNLELLLSPERRNAFYAEIDDLYNDYRGKLDVQRSANTTNQLKRYRALPTTGGIIRPNGDIRLDCMAPFIIGNVLSEDFFEVWKSKSQDCWSRPEVAEYISGFAEDSSVNNVYTNYSGKDILLNW